MKNTVIGNGMTADRRAVGRRVGTHPAGGMVPGIIRICLGASVRDAHV